MEVGDVAIVGRQKRVLAATVAEQLCPADDDDGATVGTEEGEEGLRQLTGVVAEGDGLIGVLQAAHLEHHKAIVGDALHRALALGVVGSETDAGQGLLPVFIDLKGAVGITVCRGDRTDGAEGLESLLIFLAADYLHDLLDGHACGRKLIAGVFIDCGHKGATESRFKAAELRSRAAKQRFKSYVASFHDYCHDSGYLKLVWLCV